MSDNLYLEKMEINKRLQAVEKELTTLSAEMRSWTAQTKDLLDSHSTELWGTKDPESPGLKLNVDRLIQRGRFAAWVLGILFVAVIGIVFDFVRERILHQ